MLDAHEHIMCGPESPWLSEHKEHPNLQRLATHLKSAPSGPARCYSGLEPEDIDPLIATFVDQLLSKAALAQGKQRWADKTPKNMLQLPYLQRLFPNARFVHVLRDGRAVALSTIQSRWKKLDMGDRYARNTFENALLRWAAWIERFETTQPPHLFTLKFERLVTEPKAQMQDLLHFLDEPFSPRVLQPYAIQHDRDPVPRESLRSFDQHEEIDARCADRWQHTISPAQQRIAQRLIGAVLLRVGYR